MEVIPNPEPVPETVVADSAAAAAAASQPTPQTSSSFFAFFTSGKDGGVNTPPPEAIVPAAMAASISSSGDDVNGGGGGGISMFQGFVLGALVVLVLFGLFQARLLKWLGRGVKNNAKEEEEEEEKKEEEKKNKDHHDYYAQPPALHSGSAADAAPLDVAAEMGSVMTGTSLQPAFIDPTREPMLSGASARHGAGGGADADAAAKRRRTGGGVWAASSTSTNLLGSASGVQTSRQIGLMHSGQQSVQAPPALKFEYTTFQPKS